MTDNFVERACERLVLDFAFFSDHRDYEALASLFTPDGTMARPSGAPLSGRAAILDAYRSRPADRMTRHICTNIRITVESPERARGFTYALLYTANANEPPERHLGIKADASHMVGEFEDDFVRTEDGWRIASRRARFVMHT
jgi:ketosteroid isomerase-like protein